MSKVEKGIIIADYTDELNWLNNTAQIEYSIYSNLFDLGVELLDRMYELGLKDGSEQ